MGYLYVYDPWPTAVDTMGLCGPLTPTKATCIQEKNGDFSLEIKHPIDAAGKWAYLVNGNIVKANVPMRTTPVIRNNGTGSASYYVETGRYAVKSAATRADRSVFATTDELPNVVQPVRMAVLEPGTAVYPIYTAPEPYNVNWKHVVWAGGRGWIKTSAIELVQAVTFSAARAATEQIIPSPSTRPQLFRIYAVSVSDSGVTAKARHVSYDLSGVMSTTAAGEINFSTAATSAFSNTTMLTPYVRSEWFENTAYGSTRDYPALTRVGTIEAVMAPSNSLVGVWPVTLLRDNWIFTFLTDAEYASGMTIDYGKNLRGVTMDVDTTDIWDAILPVGQTSKGKPLIVPFGTYTVDGQSITVTGYNTVVSPSNAYPVPHIGVMDMGSSVKATGTTSTALNAAYVKLIRAALAKFSDEKCDLPVVTLDVDFLRIGDTAEYAQYRDMGRLYLHDTVRVRHPRLGIDVTTQVNKTVWDCLVDRYDNIELGSVRKNYARSRLAGWQIPGFASLKSYVDTISNFI